MNLTEPKKPGFFALIRQPAVLAIALALLVVVGVLVYFTINRMNDFPGKDTVMELAEEANALNGSEFESINPTTAGKLDDWFVMKGFEGFSVPQELQEAKAVGCRIGKHEDIEVAQVALDRKNAMILVFRLADLNIEADAAGWHIFQQDDLAVAACTDKQNLCVVLFQGNSDDMPEFLKTVGK